jgi:hypothetical protein
MRVDMQLDKANTSVNWTTLCIVKSESVGNSCEPNAARQRAAEPRWLFHAKFASQPPLDALIMPT